MNADTYFCQGSSHSVCQDYATNEFVNCPESEMNRCFAVLSDGCSTAKDSDWGARLLTLAAAQQLRRWQTIEKAFEIGSYVAQTNCLSLGLNEDALFATLGAVVGESWGAVASLIGDGFVIARRRKDKALEVREVEFSSGAPAYIAYNLKSDWMERYCKLFGEGTVTISHYVIYNNAAREISAAENKVTSWQEYETLREMRFPKEEYDLVAITSDGLKTFTERVKNETTISTKSIHPALNIIPELMDFKGYAGQFVQRRCRWVFREFAEKGWQHYDDFSIGVVYNGPSD